MKARAYLWGAVIGTIPGCVCLWLSMHSDNSPDFMARGWGVIASCAAVVFGAVMGPAFVYLYHVQKRGY